MTRHHGRCSAEPRRQRLSGKGMRSARAGGVARTSSGLSQALQVPAENVPRRVHVGAFGSVARGAPEFGASDPAALVGATAIHRRRGSHFVE